MGVGAAASPDNGGFIADFPPSLAITTTSLPAGSIGDAYSQILAASAGNPPYTWKLSKGSKMPAGLKLGKKTGVISGKPTKSSKSSTFTVEVLDTKSGKPKTQNTATATLTITIS